MVSKKTETKPETKAETKTKKPSSSVAAALKPELKIINSPLSPAPKQQKPKRSVIAKPESLEEKAQRLEKKAEEQHIVILLTSSTHYRINWILIRRKFITIGNIFRRKKKPVSSISNQNPGGALPMEKPLIVKRSLWLRYCAFWNSKFNKPKDENEILYEDIAIDIHGKPRSVEDIIFRSDK